MRPIIGIVGRTDTSIKGKNTICVFENYRRAIINSGGNPILILPPQTFDYGITRPKDSGKLSSEEKNMLLQQLKICHGFIIQGGDKAFDYDRFVIKFANEFNIPILGICLGMQQMCNYNNDNKNIKNENDHHKQIELAYVHEVTIDKNSKLYSIIGEQTFKVSSNHNYHVPNSGDYQIVGYSNDNLIEAIEKKEDLFNIGLQWHPEKNYDDNIQSQKIFKAFIEAAISKMDE